MKRDQKLYMRFDMDFIFPNKYTIVIDFLINQFFLSYQFSHINSPISILPHLLFMCFDLASTSSRYTEPDTGLLLRGIRSQIQA